MQNAAAWLVLEKRRRDSASLALQELHWLKIEARITFKMLLLMYKSFNGRPDEYLMLETPNFHTKHGKRLFEYKGTRLWNALSLHVRTEEDIEKFKTHIKTMLFADYDSFKRTAFKYNS